MLLTGNIFFDFVSNCEIYGFLAAFRVGIAGRRNRLSLQSRCMVNRLPFLELVK